MTFRADCALGALTLALAAPATALAQTTTTDAKETPAAVPNADIVVTAQKRSQRLQDTPLSIAAVSGTDIVQRGVTNIKTLTNFIPNVELTNTNRPTAGGSAYAAWIRGVGTGDYAYPTDPGVGIYVDGVYLARTLGGLLSMTDIERVEVLRGPQGTLYGRNTIGGAINVVSTQPKLSGAPIAQVAGRVGSYGRADVTASLNAPLVEDKLGAKFSVGYFSSDGWGHQLLSGARLNGEKRLVMRGGLRWQASDDFSVDIRGDFSHQRNRGVVTQIAGVLPGAPPALVSRFNTIAAPSQSTAYGLPAGTAYPASFVGGGTYNGYGESPRLDNYDMGGASATATWSRSPAFEAKSITAWRKMKTHIAVDGDNSPFTVSTTDETIRDTQFSQEFQFSGKLLEDRLKYLVGLYYFAEDGTSDKLSYSFHGVYEITGLASDARDTATFQRYKARSYAAFTQEDITLVPGLELTLGARVNRDDKDFTVQVTLPELNGQTSIPLQTRTAGWTSFTPKVGLNWKPARDVMLYGSFSSGFKSGGFSNPTATMAAPIYQPEKLDTFEAGLKSQWLDRKLTFNLAGFYSTWRDIQLNIIVAGPTGGIVNLTGNGGTARLYGFEGELQAQPVPGLRFNLGVGYTHNAFTSLASGALAAGITLGTKLPHVPAWSITPGVQYDLDTGIGHVRLRSDLSYRSAQCLTIADANSVQPGYALLGARIAFIPKGLPNLELGVEGTNLTDHRYRVYQQSASLFGVILTQPGDPRLLAATATMKF